MAKKNKKVSNSFMILICVFFSVFVFLSYLSFIDNVKTEIVESELIEGSKEYTCNCETLSLGAAVNFYYNSSYSGLALTNTFLFYILFMVLGYSCFREKLDYKTTLKYAGLGAIIAVILISIYMINFENVLVNMETYYPMKYCVEQCNWHFNVLLDGYIVPMIGAIILALIWSTLGFGIAKYKSKI
ncbi:hypothetical protein KO317_01510 [Candidatus Micrarchaeota archaeon]|nr:hypothetical protein [Candidatus Micrarchaeota archaeon]